MLTGTGTGTGTTSGEAGVRVGSFMGRRYGISPASSPDASRRWQAPVHPHQIASMGRNERLRDVRRHGLGSERGAGCRPGVQKPMRNARIYALQGLGTLALVAVLGPVLACAVGSQSPDVGPGPVTPQSDSNDAGSGQDDAAPTTTTTTDPPASDDAAVPSSPTPSDDAGAPTPSPTGPTSPTSPTSKDAGTTVDSAARPPASSGGRGFGLRKRRFVPGVRSADDRCGLRLRPLRDPHLRRERLLRGLLLQGPREQV